jgi:hypothetical protein
MPIAGRRAPLIVTVASEKRVSRTPFLRAKYEWYFGRRISVLLPPEFGNQVDFSLLLN